MVSWRFGRGARRSGKVASGGAARFGVLRPLRALVRDENATAGLEFAMVGPIFLLLILAVLENGLALWQQSVLDNATRDAARLIETGQAQSGGTSFVTQLCNEITGLMKCSALQYRVQTGSSFSAMSPAISTGSGGTATGFSSYPTAVSGGTAGKDTLVQVIYTRSYIVPWLGKIMSGSNDYEQLIATTAFQTEPY